MNILLWILQVLLAMLFLFAGGMKLVLPMNVLAAQSSQPGQIAFPALFLKFIGLCELLGGLGLILPGVFKRNQQLIPLAALGLLILMIGAVVVTFIPGGLKVAIMPLVVALLLAFVAYGRWRLSPLGYRGK